MNTFTDSNINTSNHNWASSISALLFVSIMLVLALPAKADMVNINKADEAALQQNLEGIGPKKAEAIVNYRKKNGPFNSIDDLSNVPGVGKEIMQKNRKNLSTSRGLTKAQERIQKNNNSKDSKKLSSRERRDEMKDGKSSKGKSAEMEKRTKDVSKSRDKKSAKNNKTDKKLMKDKTDKKPEQTKKTVKEKSMLDKKAKKEKKSGSNKK